MSGLVGKKIGMTSLFDENGKNVPCTIIEAGPCTVTQVKKYEKDGYSSIQISFEEKKKKLTNKSLLGLYLQGEQLQPWSFHIILKHLQAFQKL